MEVNDVSSFCLRFIYYSGYRPTWEFRGLMGVKDVSMDFCTTYLHIISLKLSGLKCHYNAALFSPTLY